MEVINAFAEWINAFARFFAICAAAVFFTGVVYLGVLYWRQARTRYPDDNPEPDEK